MSSVCDLARSDESVLAVVPSHRVSTADFYALLKDNGVKPRALGVGSGRVVDADGRRARVGVLVIAVPLTEAAKAQNLARLCGITAVEPK